MINLETPKKFRPLVEQAHQVAVHVMRPISRKYDTAEHERPVELDMLAKLIDGMNDGGETGGAGAAGVGSRDSAEQNGNGNGAGPKNKNGSNMSTALSIMETCWGDVGLTLAIPGQGLGNSAIAAVATDEQLKRYGGKWASMAITEPESGSDSASIRTTAVLDEETGEYVLNGEKIYVTAGERCELVVVWASLDRSIGRAAIKSFIVERSNPGMKLDRLEHKLGIRASDTAAFRLEDCRVPKEALLGNPEIDTKKGFGGVMQTFDNTRPLVAAMAVGVARACLDHTREVLTGAGVELDADRPALTQSAAAAKFLALEADYEAARLLTLQATWMADNRKPNSLQASLAKAKAGRTGVDVALGCIELCGAHGYDETELLEKWSRDAKILDIFEGTQQIQLLIIARQLLKKTSAELK
ncbi:acyl-CoA dehydrogenase [Conexibacter sp. W3-3-2]|uniref:Acyl-CoA dehydrogenase n=1 Tax=Paraconexibacter algicola TaxID=2133960 RepID=A0A2T4UFZ3_9ACTN|nr:MULTISPECIES: acyl-CoA dehydrogenase family protein [Solirubrobacterales]MTD44406.1 acyl-CoA dehydrogenase [Conexibacter sp. W3-3-2]PTL58156.1 acyl-CoA dehydrogenase [Paraconexibacter algicola]